MRKFDAVLKTWNLFFHVKISKMATKVARILPNSVSQFEIPHTGIPIIIRPFVVKKAYVVHSKVTSFHADLKAQWLTKTCLRKGLPDAILNNQDDFSHKQLTILKKRMQKSFLQTISSQKIGVKWKMNYDAEFLESLLPSLLLQCWHLVDNLQGSVLDFQPCIRTFWCRDHNFYQTMFNPGYVLRTVTPQQLYEKDITGTNNENLPGPYRPVDLGVFRHPTKHIPNSPGYNIDHKMPYPRTMFLSDFTSKNQEQMLYHGMQVMFSQLVSIALQEGYHLGQHIGTPLTTKCVITNGQVCMFMAYQLNTLSMQEDFGAKNIAWFVDFKTFYDTNSDPFRKGRKAFYEVLQPEIKTLELNEECVKMFLTFLV